MATVHGTGGGSAAAVEEVDVVIVGGGVAGLTAAHRIAEKDGGLRLLVLEAKNRLGGRTLTLPLKAANNTEDVWDLGGQWVGSPQKNIMALLEELGMETYKQHIDGTKIMQLGNSRIRKYNTTIPSLSLFGLIDMQTLLTRLDKMAKQVPLEDPMSCKHAEEWDRITLGEYVYRHTWTKDVRDAMEVVSETMFGVETHQLSLLYALMDVNGIGGVQPAVEATKDSAQEFKIKGGAQQICVRLAEKLGMEKVLLEQPVCSVVQDEDGVTLRTECGKQIRCRRAILAVPPMQAARMEFSPSLPGDKAILLNHMPVGHIIKVIITYEKAFWREAGYSGEVVTYGGDSHTEGCTTGPLGIVYDATSPNGNPALVAFISGRKAVQYSVKTAEERKKALLQSLVELFGSDASSCLDFAEKDWRQEPYNGGCPISVATPGVMTYYTGIRKPFGRIHFAGTETASQGLGFLDGAVQSGQRAATEVLYHLRPQAVSAQELIGTAYDTSRIKQSRVSSHQGAALKWIVIFSFGVAVTYAASRVYHRWSK